jgi:hypothetical protein
MKTFCGLFSILFLVHIFYNCTVEVKQYIRKTGVWWFVPVILATQESKMGGSRVRGQPGLKVLRPCLKKNKTKTKNQKGWGDTQVLEYVPRIHETLGLISSIAKNCFETFFI